MAPGLAPSGNCVSKLREFKVQILGKPYSASNFLIKNQTGRLPTDYPLISAP
ncbi:MAG: hypothetical protein FD161_395 [Limisphaerales bacterium]|nr:MAG: hypothetical protein FD161_395 [Limisphaerales bacterium]KAG0510300.1 MAG: hypothetical protein E1N63_395 [Limisphaerales bacterium]TXT51487.1 MAG: hypothetical protein FD140_1525 [Limisphaerales bacterium]